MPVRVSLLHHALDDGTAHVDLLVATDAVEVPDDERRVPTWRCRTRPDSAPPGSRLELERIGDHRGLYLRLDAERQLDRGRGRVTPIRSGWAEPDAGWLRIRWADGGESRWRMVEGSRGTELVIGRSEADLGANDETAVGRSPTSGDDSDRTASA